MINLLSIVGARPQFIKLSPIVNSIKNHYSKYFRHTIIHTGQHFSDNMSNHVFENLKLPNANYNLNINELSHCEMISSMLYSLPPLIEKINPDYILLYGDTNSTLAGALASLKLNKRIAHIESGVRSYDMTMPEEQNRVITDRISDILFAPCLSATKNLRNEGVNPNKIFISGDILYDAYKNNINKVGNESFLEKYNLKRNEYHYLTIHRQSNLRLTSLKHIMNYLECVKKLFIFPIHPNTKK